MVLYSRPVVATALENLIMGNLGTVRVLNERLGMDHCSSQRWRPPSPRRCSRRLSCVTKGLSFLFSCLTQWPEQLHGSSQRWHPTCDRSIDPPALETITLGINRLRELTVISIVAL